MKINTGRGTIPLITLIGIWSISALTSLPGLAVSPILGQLSTTFPDASELDIQFFAVVIDHTFYFVGGQVG